jgi:hypothetical protein
MKNKNHVRYNFMDFKAQNPGHVARMEEKNAYRILVGNSDGKNHWEDQDIGGWTILKWILDRQDGMVWTGSI